MKGQIQISWVVTSGVAVVLATLGAFTANTANDAKIESRVAVAENEIKAIKETNTATVQALKDINTNLTQINTTLKIKRILP